MLKSALRLNPNVHKQSIRGSNHTATDTSVEIAGFERLAAFNQIAKDFV